MYSKGMLFSRCIKRVYFRATVYSRVARGLNVLMTRQRGALRSCRGRAGGGGRTGRWWCVCGGADAGGGGRACNVLCACFCACVCVSLSLSLSLSVRVCVCECVRACVRVSACVRVCAVRGRRRMRVRARSCRTCGGPCRRAPRTSPPTYGAPRPALYTLYTVIPLHRNPGRAEHASTCLVAWLMRAST